MPLKEIGAACAMAPSKAHRYLHSLVAAEIRAESELEGLVDIDTAEIIRKVREQGYAMKEAAFVPRSVGIAAPVINWDEEICAAVTVIARATRDPDQHRSAAAGSACSARTCPPPPTEAAGTEGNLRNLADSLLVRPAGACKLASCGPCTS